MRFSAEQELLRRSVADYARTDVAPRLDAWSVEGRLPRQAVRSLAALGVQGLLIDEAHGGMGAGLVEAGIVCEELGRVDPPLTLYVQLPAIVARILAGAEQAVADRWLSAIADGSATPCFALSEPGSGSDAAALTASARREGDEWVLSGEKASSSLAPEADIAVVFARTRFAAAVLLGESVALRALYLVERRGHDRYLRAQERAQGALPHGQSSFFLPLEGHTPRNRFHTRPARNPGWKVLRKISR